VFVMSPSPGEVVDEIRIELPRPRPVVLGDAPEFGAYADRIYGAAAWWLRSSPFVPVLLALGFAAGFIHYLLDRAAFRFSSPDVRRAARGLLQS